MATKKIMAAFVAALLVMMNVVLTSCEGSEDIALTQAAPVTKFVDRPVIVQNYINNYAWFVDNSVYVNGAVALT